MAHVSKAREQLNRLHTVRSTGFTRIELVIVVVIVGGLFAFLYPAIQSTRNPKGPHGEVYPTAPPDESNRVTHRTGLSIVAPVNWDQMREGAQAPHLQIAARGTPGRRLKSVISIWRCDPPPEPHTLNRCQLVQFQGAQAYEICQVEREDTFDDPASSRYDLYLQRDGGWWQVSFLVADRMTSLPSSIRQYVNTVKFPQTEQSPAETVELDDLSDHLPELPPAR